MAAITGPFVRRIVEDYLAELALRGSSADHLRNSGLYLRKVLEACPQLKPEQIVRYRAARVSAGAAHRTVNFAVDCARSCLRWAQSMGMIEANPLERLRRLPQRECDRVHNRRPMTDEEAERFLRALRRIQKRYQVPQVPLYETMIETGLRWGEATSLRPEDLRGNELVVQAKSAKTRRTRAIPIPRALARVLRKLGGERLFLSPKGRPWNRQNRGNAMKTFREALDLAKIARRDQDGRVLDIHALRYTACSRLLNRKVPLHIVQRVLGHLDPKMTLRVYAEVNAPDVRKALAKAWRR